MSESQIVPASQQTFLALDYGLKRTGVAVGNRLMKTATPQGTIAAEGDARFARIAERIKEWQPDALVIGCLPTPMGVNTKTRCAPASSGDSCGAALAWPFTRWMSATPPPKPIRWGPRTPMRRLPRSFLNSF